MGRLFSLAYVHVYHRIDQLAFTRVRRRLIGRVRGDVLEVGVGTGLSFPHLPPGIRYTGIDPDPAMLRYAIRRGSPGPLVDCGSERLPFRDRTFDSVLSTFSFCSVRDPKAAALEIARVLKEDGQLLLLEHVRSDRRLWAAVQDALAPVWSAVLQGCHVNRDVLGALASAGLETREVHALSGAILPVIWGTAGRRNAR